MSIIIDGYNLLGTCGFIGSRGGPGMLERARSRLLGFLAQIFSPAERGGVTVVFDSAVRLPDTPDYVLHNGIHVHFASGHRDADEMIIDMLLRHSAPKSLLIVSSDHQIQQAAKRRRARFVDSDKWYDEMIEANRANPQVAATAAQIQLEVQLELKEMAAAGSDPDQTKLLEAFSRNLERWVAPPDPGLPAAGQKQPAPPQRGSEITPRVGRGVDPPRPKEPLEPKSDSIDDPSVAGLDLSAKLDAPLKHGLLTDLDEEQWLAALDREFEAADWQGGLQAKRAAVGREATARPAGRQPNATPGGQDSRPSAVSETLAAGPRPLEPARTANPPIQAESTRVAAAESVRRVPPGPDAEPGSDACGPGDGGPDDVAGNEPNARPTVSEQQVKRWNRQLAETDLAIFPPGYGEEVLFAESFEIDDRLKKKRRPGKG